MRQKQKERMQKEINRYWDDYQLLNRWLELKNRNKSAAVYFEEEGISHIAVYGMGDLAMRLVEDLEGSSVIIAYGIDRDVCSARTGVPEVYAPQQDLPSVEAVVVTPFYEYDAIVGTLEGKVTGRIISLEEVIWSV